MQRVRRSSTTWDAMAKTASGVRTDETIRCLWIALDGELRAVKALTEALPR